MRDPFDEARDAIEDQHSRELDAVDRQYERDRKRLEDHALGLQEQLTETQEAAAGWQAAHDRERTKYEDLAVRYEAVCKTNDALTSRIAEQEGVIDRLRDRVRELQHQLPRNR